MGKIHLDLDGVSTACGIELCEFDGDVTDDLEEATCKACKTAYLMWRTKLDKEWRDEKKQRASRFHP